ncbi:MULTISPECIES: glutamate synthase large subunit [unclassified Arthrobacter]|uniref:glutamate synthase large subunit n=1 Tax=unclassified Arthrobacter TaxID=235627 RepID=UPI001E41591C|nr:MULTISPECIES: glutamate synthase large subunit [unclassified Arthrobacter]MCC9145228.1 glutamate synthase large subunit [Arthrobacter sp. zg-Y919]MDK1276456.1 glutamate synthase large subunit [Arthrobacter sp. zg.Y919]WIB01945.1 glutamate synthase large subunit [Arthrobacter sp. zg-Y919]
MTDSLSASTDTVVSPFVRFAALPEDSGLYRAGNEKDACGLAVIATLRREPTHEIVQAALVALRNLEHRGAVGADEGTGDGAGLLTQVPDEFFRAVVDFELPAAGGYAVGTAFLPTEDREQQTARGGVEMIAASEGLRVLGWREVPIVADLVGAMSRACMPYFVQVFLAPEEGTGAEDLDARAFRVRKRSQNKFGVYFPSLSSKTMVYKGMVTTAQLEPFFPDLSDPRFKTRLGIVHSRFSTNTFPSWPLAQPFRAIAHNGEINTVKGNRNWMRARQSQMKNPLLGQTPEELFPICTPGASDSASFDEVAELLMLSGRPITHAIMMMIPEAWENHATMDPARRAFYQYHSMLMEPWDGPAAVSFTDGVSVGAVLDRNGLRPARYWVTDDGLVVLASEVGVVDIDPAKVVRKGRVSPGKMFLVDTDEGRLIEDDEIKAEVAAANPWADWVKENQVRLEELPEREHVLHTKASINRRQRTFGYTQEELRILLGPMARTGAEPLGAMGSDTPIAVLSKRPRLLFDYFVQSFAQVTNPPLDSIREELVTSMQASIGPNGNLLSLKQVKTSQVALKFPVINNDELAKIANLTDDDGDRIALKVRGLYRPEGGEGELRARISEICEKVSGAVNRGVQYIVLSDRDSNAQWAPIPSLLLLSAVHNHLLKSANRTKISVLVEAGDVREVHHVAALIGYGASAVNPYLAMESCEELVRNGDITGVTGEQAVGNLIKGLGKGVLKIMSKMGISTVASYCGAQTFEALGLGQELVDEFFHGTQTQLGGVGLDVIAAEAAARHAEAYPSDGVEEPHRALDNGGEYQWRREGPPHLFNPETVFRLQHATRERRYDVFKAYTSGVNDQSKNLMTLRGLLDFRTGDRTPVPLDEVEPVSSIVKRFSTGAMSYGSISQEAHETLAIAMNRLGAKSNTGEGGEDPERLLDPERSSAIKQVASGRFGVTSLYLTNAQDIQIKMAQGAKPGEGGQLMAQKVYPWVARTRHSTPGVGLISPPPHHDIYSIEDLAQLIYDLKRSNPGARVHVKLVSEAGIGTVAAGVTKAKADVVLVSGHDGGTGASPLNSLKHAGAPWELGLAETQQTLMLNGLRDRVVVQVDGQLKTGRDVVMAALLGGEEFGFATAPLVVSGCIMMRVCHLDTCPVGVATQNPELRARFSGKPEFVVNFFEFIAEEIREILAELGFRTLEEAIGRTELLDTAAAIDHWKADGLDLEPILRGPEVDPGAPLRNMVPQNHELDQHFDNRLIEMSADALQNRAPVRIALDVVNTDRSVGTMLGHTVTKTFGVDTLAPDTIDVTLTGQAGQSLGAFLPAGITLRLFGDSNDYVGKGLSGGRIIVRPDRANVFAAERNVIAGNVIGYGATSGEMFLSGQVGERFLVRNSGATAVVEGIGDHGCEYMTGGQALILGRTGRNFGAGMSGGTAFVVDLEPANVNKESLERGELLLVEPDAEDIDIVRGLLVRHLEETGSDLAQKMLESFEDTASRITKVLPRDYAAVLGARASAAEAGLDPDGAEAWNKILEVTGG